MVGEMDDQQSDSAEGGTQHSFQYLPFNTPLRGALDGCP